MTPVRRSPGQAGGSGARGRPRGQRLRPIVQEVQSPNGSQQQPGEYRRADRDIRDDKELLDFAWAVHGIETSKPAYPNTWRTLGCWAPSHYGLPALRRFAREAPPPTSCRTG
ncbi:hypothetical protein KPATCC21470_8584 [Kitasatospora purpeofusca]